MSDELEIVGDEAQEARVVAAILGEASEFEKEEVARLCAENAELAVFRRRIEAVDGLLTNASSDATEGGEWRLSQTKRDLIFEKLGEKETVVRMPVRRRRLGRTLAALAAVLALVATLTFSDSFRDFSTGAKTPEIALYEASQVLKVREENNVPKSEAPAPVRVPSVAVSDRARVIASNTASGRSIPPPSQSMIEADFGIGKDFGTGWKSDANESLFLGRKPSSAIARVIASEPEESAAREWASATDEYDAFEGSDDAFGDTEEVKGNSLVRRDSRRQSLLAEVDRDWESQAPSLSQFRSDGLTPRNEENVLRELVQLAYEPNDLSKAEMDDEESLAVLKELRNTFSRSRSLGGVDNPRTLEERREKIFESKKSLMQVSIYSERLNSLEGNAILQYAAELPIAVNPVARKHAQYLGVRREIESLKAQGLSNKHPKVKELVVEMERLTTELDTATEELKQSLEVEIETYREELISLGDPQTIAAFEASLLLKEQELAQAQRQLQVAIGDEKDAASDLDSTFSLNVSDVSFKLAQSALAQGEWPKAVRVEEFVNAFSYQETVLAPGQRVGLTMEQAAHPALSQRNLLRVSLQTAATGRGAGVPLRLTIVLDKSGSMERPDRARAIEEAFRVLVAQLGPADRVTLLSFSRRPKLLADSIAGSEGERLLEMLRETPSEGGTNVEEALVLAGSKAREHYAEEAQNRIILLTDGIANLGESVPVSLMDKVAAFREEGIAFDACGVGATGVNDAILEALTRKGDGRYYLLSNAAESGADFARQVAGALRPAAKNVKVQVVWNPERVGQWRLYGFKNHRLKREDFRNDAVDAAELAAEEEGVALYHLEVKPDGEGPLGVVRVRFLDVQHNEMLEREWAIPYQGEALPLESAEAKIQLAAVAGLTAEKLARSAVGNRVEWTDLLARARQLKPLFPREKRLGELEEMIERAKELE